MLQKMHNWLAIIIAFVINISAIISMRAPVWEVNLLCHNIGQGFESVSKNIAFIHLEPTTIWASEYQRENENQFLFSVSYFAFILSISKPNYRQYWKFWISLYPIKINLLKMMSLAIFWISYISHWPTSSQFGCFKK